MIKGVALFKKIAINVTLLTMHVIYLVYYLANFYIDSVFGHQRTLEFLLFAAPILICPIMHHIILLCFTKRIAKWLQVGLLCLDLVAASLMIFIIIYVPLPKMLWALIISILLILARFLAYSRFLIVEKEKTLVQ